MKNLFDEKKFVKHITEVTFNKKLTKIVVFIYYITKILLQTSDKLCLEKFYKKKSNHLNESGINYKLKRKNTISGAEVEFYARRFIKNPGHCCYSENKFSLASRQCSPMPIEVFVIR